MDVEHVMKIEVVGYSVGRLKLNGMMASQCGAVVR